MASHFYSLSSDGSVFIRDRSKVVVATSSQFNAGTVDIEIQINDGALSHTQVYHFLEQFADYFAIRDQGIVAAGTLLGTEPS